jgi:carbonic anhydrase
MEDLYQGLIRFRNKEYEEHKELFKELDKGQDPHTLFINCADSRIDPLLMTHSKPGELFIMRNVANVVPPFDHNDQFPAVGAVVEYAVKVLKVANIIVCGHSRCGGCQALSIPEEELSGTPHVRNWIKQLAPVRDEVNSQAPDADDGTRQWLMETVNVIHQIESLRSYPIVSETEAAGKLKLHGWYYVIKTGEVFAFNEETKEFEPANPREK